MTKKASIISFKLVEHHPRINRIANSFVEEGYDVVVYGLGRQEGEFTNENGVKFVLFKNDFVMSEFFKSSYMLLPKLIKLAAGLLILTYCKIRKI